MQNSNPANGDLFRSYQPTVVVVPTTEILSGPFAILHPGDTYNRGPVRSLRHLSPWWCTCWGIPSVKLVNCLGQFENIIQNAAKMMVIILRVKSPHQNKAKVPLGKKKNQTMCCFGATGSQIYIDIVTNDIIFCWWLPYHLLATIVAPARAKDAKRP